jgi:hypothetical protein
MRPRSRKFAEGGTPNPAEYAEMWPTPDVRGFTNEGALKILVKVVEDREEFSGMAYGAARKKKEALWPTPTAYDWNTAVKSRVEPGSKTYKSNLKEAVQIWPTPNSRDWKDSGETQGNRHSPNLGTMVKRYPTPRVHGLSNGSGNVGAVNNLYEQGKITEEERRSMRSGNGGQLNPMFVAWLMGYPLAWADTRADLQISLIKGETS